MSQQVKSHVARSVDPSAQGITASALPTSLVPVLDDPTEREDEHFRAEATSGHPEPRRSEKTNEDVSHDIPPEDSDFVRLPVVRHRSKPVSKSVDRTLMISQPVSSSLKSATAGGTAGNGTWTQVQQKRLESALNQVPKGASDRWDRIAELVPDKTKVNYGIQHNQGGYFPVSIKFPDFSLTYYLARSGVTYLKVGYKYSISASELENFLVYPLLFYKISSLSP